MNVGIVEQRFVVSLYSVAAQVPGRQTPPDVTAAGYPAGAAMHLTAPAVPDGQLSSLAATAVDNALTAAVTGALTGGTVDVTADDC